MDWEAALAKIKVHAGDWLKGEGSVSPLMNTISLPNRTDPWLGLQCEHISLDNLSEVESATEESVKRLGGTIGWGLVGGALLGPVGLLAGLLAGGRAKDVTFVARFKDGRKVLATTDSKSFTKLKAAVF